MTIGDKLPGSDRHVFDNSNTLFLTDYRGQKQTGEAVKINVDTGIPEC